MWGTICALPLYCFEESRTARQTGYLAVQYNANSFSFGIGAFNPFKNVSRSIMENKNALAPFRRESFSNASQTIVATLTWNFSFGKTHSSSSKSLNNQDADYGVKSSYK